MEGRIQKAREGKWNGGFAPYGYQLIDGLHKAIIEEDMELSLDDDEGVESVCQLVRKNVDDKIEGKVVC